MRDHSISRLLHYEGINMKYSDTSKKKQRILDEMNAPTADKMGLHRTAIHLRNKDWWQVALLASEQQRSANDIINEAVAEYLRHHKQSKVVRDALSERVASIEKKIALLQEQYNSLKEQLIK